MEEIGCHFKFEKIIGNIYHDTNLLLSSGRNCLKYIINERNITTLFLPLIIYFRQFLPELSSKFVS